MRDNDFSAVIVRLLTDKQRDVLGYEQNGSPKPWCDLADDEELNDLVRMGFAVKVRRSYLRPEDAYFCSTEKGRALLAEAQGGGDGE